MVPAADIALRIMRACDHRVPTTPPVIRSAKAERGDWQASPAQVSHRNPHFPVRQESAKFVGLHWPFSGPGKPFFFMVLAPGAPSSGALLTTRPTPPIRASNPHWPCQLRPYRTKRSRSGPHAPILWKPTASFPRIGDECGFLRRLPCPVERCSIVGLSRTRGGPKSETPHGKTRATHM